MSGILWHKITKAGASVSDIKKGLHPYRYFGQTPIVGQECLVTTGKSAWVDTWIGFLNGTEGFEKTRAEIIYWLPVPPPPNEWKG